MLGTLDLKQMSRPEKVRLMEEIWQDLSADEQEVEPPSWHGEIIAARMVKVGEGNATFMTLEELEARLARIAPPDTSIRRGAFSSTRQ